MPANKYSERRGRYARRLALRCGLSRGAAKRAIFITRRTPGLGQTLREIIAPSFGTIQHDGAHIIHLNGCGCDTCRP